MVLYLTNYAYLRPIYSMPIFGLSTVCLSVAETRARCFWIRFSWAPQSLVYPVPDFMPLVRGQAWEPTGDTGLKCLPHIEGKRHFPFAPTPVCDFGQVLI